MHVRAPHGRVAFGLGRLRAAGPAGSTVVSPTTSTVALLLGEEAAAAGGGGCCWGEEVASHCCRGGAPQEPRSLLVCCRGGSRLDCAGPSRCWQRSDSVSPGLDALRGHTVRHPSYHYPGWAMLTTPSPLGVSGRAVRVSIHSYHYPGWAMLTTPSPLGVSGRAVRVSLSVSPRLIGSWVRAGSVRLCVSAPDGGGGQGQFWPARR
jgi:hypothetical protein